MKLSPAEVVIRAFGGVRATAKAIGRNPGSVCRWRQSKDRGGSNGNVPRGAKKPILDAAKAQNLDINAHDLIYGRELSA